MSKKTLFHLTLLFLNILNSTPYMPLTINVRENVHNIKSTTSMHGWISLNGDYVWEDDGVVLDASQEAKRVTDKAEEMEAERNKALVPPKLRSGEFKPKQR